jgi:hypothetical protein
LTSDRLIIDDARDQIPLFQIDRVSGQYAYFDTGAFQRLPNQYTVAPDGPTLNELRAPGAHLLNASLAKTYPIRERLKFKIRAEATGVTNTQNFGAPGTNLASASTFWVITTASGSRSMQASARLEW